MVQEPSDVWCLVQNIGSEFQFFKVGTSQKCHCIQSVSENSVSVSRKICNTYRINMGNMVHEVSAAEINSYFSIWRALLENPRIERYDITNYR